MKGKPGVEIRLGWKLFARMVRQRVYASRPLEEEFGTWIVGDRWFSYATGVWFWKYYIG